MSEERRRPVALVTGAGVRLGRAIAEGLAEDGCDLVLHACRSQRPLRALAQELRRRKVQVALLRGDLREVKTCQRLAREAWRAYGRIDILINNAAVYWPTPLKRLNERELEAFWSLNLRAPYILSAELGRRMKKRGTGCIVNMACLSGLRAWKNYVPYSISKAGVVSLTHGLAKLLAPEVRVNAIAPGTVLPPAGLGRVEAGKLRDAIPLKRFGSPRDVVRAVKYLVESDFTTGVILPVDGGKMLQ